MQHICHLIKIFMIVLLSVAISFAQFAWPPTASTAAGPVDQTVDFGTFEFAKPLIVYTNSNNKWNKLRAGSEPIPTVSAIIRAPSAKLLRSDKGHQTVLVSGPLPTDLPATNLSTADNRDKNFGENETPKSYAFGYETTDESNNKMARHEQQDKSGKVLGFYTYVDSKGQARIVNYVADESGFHAEIKTNELGTATSAPASVIIKSVAPRPRQHLLQGSTAARLANMGFPLGNLHTKAVPYLLQANRMLPIDAHFGPFAGIDRSIKKRSAKIERK